MSMPSLILGLICGMFLGFILGVCIDTILTIHDIEKIKKEIEESRKPENVPYEAEYWDYVNGLDKALSIIECQMWVNRQGR